MSIAELKLILESFFAFNFVYAGIIALFIFSVLNLILKIRNTKQEQKNSKKEIVIGIIFSIYLATLIGGTLLDRHIETEHQMELMPFWSYLEFFRNGNNSLMVQIVFNILIFIPWPILWGSIFPTMRRFRWGVGSALLFSIFIEVTQLVFKLGLFEFDDMFHNVLGAVIGYYIWKLCRKFKQKGIEE